MTALTATYQPGSALLPPRVLLQVSGAPNPPTPGYASNFSASADSWTASGTNANPTMWSAGDSYLTLQSTVGVGGTVGNVITATRTVTGLTIGAVYKLSVTLTRSSPNAGNTRIRFATATGVYVAVPVGSNATLELTFTATATSHTINVDQQRTQTFDAERVYILAATVAPVGTWQGTTIRRTDVNGANVVVREDTGGMDVAAGTMQLWDFEAALVGPVGYAVTDGNGVVTYAYTNASASPNARINMVPNPSVEVSNAGWLSSGAGTTSAVATGGDTGTNRLRVVTGSSSSSGASIIVPGVVPGVRYGARLRVQANAVSDFRITMQWLDAAQAVISSPAATFSAVASGVFVTAFMDATAPALAAYVRVYVQRVNSSTAGLVMNVDSVHVRALVGAEVWTGAEYFDGSTASTSSTLYGWVGVPGLSPSMAVDAGQTAAGVWLSVPARAVPSLPTIPFLAVQSVLDYDESSRSNGSLHTIINRADPIANPGPLALRQGTLDVFCADYATARAIRQLLAPGDVAQLRQPTHPGMDLYLVAQDVRIAPASELTSSRRWVATLTYAEVLAA